jgi:hypothetical protein
MQVDGRIYSLFKIVKFGKFREHYNINNTNRCVGFTPDHVGPSISKIVDKRNYFIDFMRANFDLVKQTVDKSCFIDLISSINEERVVYSAGFTTAGQHLKEYFKDNTTEDEWSVEAIFDVLDKNKFEWFRSSECSFYDGKELLNTVKMNANAYAGHYTSMLFGKNKEGSDRASRQVAYKIWRTMHSIPVKNFYLWNILGREKDIKIKTKGSSEVGTRAVVTCEHPITLILCWFAQKISAIVCNTSTWDCKFNVSGEFNNTKYKRLLDKESKYDFILEADWSYYDSNIDTNFLIAAGLLICGGIPRTDKLHRNIRYLIISSIVCKYVIIPPGVVVELNRAQPSGHPFGTLTNCYVNIIYWSLIGQKIYGDNYAEMMDIEVYGDDTRAYFKYHKNLVNIDRYVKECGLKSDSLIDNFRSIGENADRHHQIDFLKRRFDTNGICWNHKKMFDKMLYPSKNRSINDQYKMVSSWYQSVPTDVNAFKVRKLFGEYIYKNFKSELDYEVIQDIKLDADHIPGSGERAKNDFVYHNYARSINEDFDNGIKIDSQTFIYRDFTTLNGYKDKINYEDNLKILSFMALNPTKRTRKFEYYSVMLGRDPPNYSSLIEIDLRFRTFVQDKTKEFINKIKFLSQS